MYLEYIYRREQYSKYLLFFSTEVLRLGNNNIVNKKCVIYLRKLRKLRTLSLKGNPVTQFRYDSSTVYLLKLRKFRTRSLEGNPVTRLEY